MWFVFSGIKIESWVRVMVELQAPGPWGSRWCNDLAMLCIAFRWNDFLMRAMPLLSQSHTLPRVFLHCGQQKCVCVCKVKWLLACSIYSTVHPRRQVIQTSSSLEKHQLSTSSSHVLLDCTHLRWTRSDTFPSIRCTHPEKFTAASPSED